MTNLNDTVDGILLDRSIGYVDAMLAVCTEDTPTRVLRNFAALVARENLGTITKALGGARPFVKAVDFLSEGDADDRLEELAEHAEDIQKFMVSALVFSPKPEAAARYQRLLRACKIVRAATSHNPGEAAYGAALWSYKAASGASRDEIGWEHRSTLAEIFRAQ